ncbi:FadR/GntR family transcriptional regulator [Nonomuraea jiangxiensis]|uniref:DNA-binding transcriptional regulator, FadR family n=1 Tax=Nonomuraea jiangxiensis TaxID=633440 RepID=A0A1G8DLA1_9ACTN|nr:FadR/GntR family transcriptional regulator [Nonomuraea jiangxiensis]SDH58180.1 DNA-binding transcriptional regulator, FadR family [Nonomuraea jiangxiensis]
MTLAESIAERLFQEIIEGRLTTSKPLPPEGELATTYNVSRLTVREAIRILRTQNVVRIRRGRGTEVNPPEEWTSLEAVVRASEGSLGPGPERLLEARRMIEIGAAQLAAERRTDEDLVQLGVQLDEMRAASAAGDVTRFVEADIRFHDVIMRASGNIFVPLLFVPFGRLLIEARRQTSAVPEIQRNAIEQHANIVDALTEGDSEQARVAMEAHMQQTQRDLRQHVLDEQP